MRWPWRAAALIAASLPIPALAQAYRCNLPDRLPSATESRGERRVVPIGGYTLALSWSPGFCRQRGGAGGFQCDPGNRFGFILHGLWPEGHGGRSPQYCAVSARVPEAVIRRNLCAMPSVALQRHQYAKHGSCTGMLPASYFDRARALYLSIRYPDMDALSRRRDLTAGQFATAFARANPGITPAMIRVRAGSDRWLDDVLLCLDTRFRPQACPAHRRGVAGQVPLRIWRGGRT